MKLMAKNRTLAIVLAMMMALMLALPLTTFAGNPGTVWTTDEWGATQDGNQYNSKGAVYLRINNFPEGVDLYVQVTTPGGDPLSDIKWLTTSTGATQSFNLWSVVTNDGDPGFADSTNEGGMYKVLVSTDRDMSNSKRDSFKVIDPGLSIQKTVRLANTTDSFVDRLTVTSSSVEVEYQFDVMNEGNVDLDGVAIIDNKISLTFASMDMEARECRTLRTTAIISDWDDDGECVNTAYAQGTYGIYDISSDSDDATVVFKENFVPNPALEIEKEVRIAGSTDENDFVRELDVWDSSVDVEYRFTLKNTGNVDLQDVSVHDPLLGLTSTPAALAAGATDDFVYGPYTILQGDWNENLFINSATAAGIYNGESVGTDTASATVEYNEQWNPEGPDIDVVKDVSPSTVGSKTTTVTYTFTVHNEGDIDLYNVVLTDSAIGYYYEVGYMTAGAVTTTSINFDLSNLGKDGYGTWNDDTFTNVVQVSGWYEQYYPEYSYQVVEEDYYTPLVVTDVDDATVTYSSSPDPGPGPRSRSTTSTTTVIEEPTPAGPVVEETPLIEEAIPAAPLPQTGGIPSLLLYGMGALLAGSGAALKLRNRNK